MIRINPDFHRASATARRIGAGAALLLSLAGAAWSCSVPVFRYALDRWPADPYVLEVSVTDAKDTGVARFLRNFTDSTPLNIAPVRSKDPGPSHLEFPHADPEAPQAWSGALDAPALPLLTESPARTELAHRILSGETGVWLLVESGEKEADERAAAMMEKRLRYLEQAAEIPFVDPEDPTSELGPGPALRVKFSVLRVRHDDAAEQPFIRMLIGPKHTTAPSTGPWLALVFGRGRVLGAWPAEGFGDEQIDEACLFLLGACSCQVKRMNPGWDLLLSVNWDEALQAMGFPAPSNPNGLGGVPPAAASVAAVGPGKGDGTQEPDPQTPAHPAAVPEALKVEPVTLAATAPAPAPGSRGAGVPAGAAAVVLLVLGSTLVWRTFRRTP